MEYFFEGKIEKFSYDGTDVKVRFSAVSPFCVSQTQKTKDDGKEIETNVEYLVFIDSKGLPNKDKKYYLGGASIGARLLAKDSEYSLSINKLSKNATTTLSIVAGIKASRSTIRIFVDTLPSAKTKKLVITKFDVLEQ